MQTEKIDQVRRYLENRMPHYLDILKTMVDINSFTYNADGVNELGEFTATIFTDLDFSFEIVHSINPSYGKHLFLYSSNYPKSANSPAATVERVISIISHLDTVFHPDEEKANQFFFRLEGDRVYGPGTVDIKGGTVMVLMVLEALKVFFPDQFVETPWLIAMDASEESLSQDFGKLCIERIPEKSRACLIFEGGTPNPDGYSLVNTRKGRAEFRVTATGRSAHAGNYHKSGANAIIQLADTVRKIADMTDYAQSLTYNVGVISGGTVVNRVPHSAEARVEMRAFSQPVFDVGYGKILSLDGSSTVSSFNGYPCEVSVDTLTLSPPWPRNQASDQLFNHWAETGKQLGLQIIPEARGGLSDGNLLWQHVPVLDGLGPVGNNAHCSERSPDGSKDQEFALLTSFVPKALLNIVALTRLIG